MQIRKLLADRNASAWLLMVFAIALHVLDETITGFLPFYNSSVAALRDRLGFFPAPTFSVELWLGGLIVGILLCLGVTVVVARGGKTIRWIAAILGMLMIFNALGHLLGSLYIGRILPGAYSSPVLLLSAVFVVLRAIRGTWHIKQVSGSGAT
jgi:hypothetical protein